jgi:5-oxoprolinase (ATP-hydrolysing)
VTKGAAGPGSTRFLIVDPLRARDPADFWKGYSLRLLGAEGKVVDESRVASTDRDTGALRLERPLEADVTVGQCYELASGEEAPVVAVRYLLGLGLDTQIPPVVVRLGTTRGTNALITRRGAKTALVTTRGFADILFIGYQNRPKLFELSIKKRVPLFAAVVEIDERVTSDGQVLLAPRPERVREQLSELRTSGIDSLAICLLHAYRFAEHEELVAQIARQVGFGEISVSSRVAPLVKIVARGDTTVMDAYLNPILRAYIGQLRSSLPSAELRIMTSAGGLVSAEQFVGKDSILSGPAGGVVGFSRAAQAAGFAQAIGFDMGGTSTDVSRFDGRFELEFETEKAGVRVVAPMISIETVAAGGGSICAFDGAKLVVGPQSAGADPGPACYGRGGKLPTVSDAACVLGYFDPDFFLGGRMKLDTNAAGRAISDIAAKVALSPEETAYRIIGLASDFMMRAIGDITINEGVNPRESTIVAGGGAAGLNIMMIAKELGCDRVVLPKVAAALSASGMQFANIVSEESASMVTLSSRFDSDRVNALLDDLTGKLEAVRRGLGERAAQYRIDYFAEARYLSQVWELDTPLPGRRFDGAADLATFVETFHQVHERVFDVRDEGSPVEIVNWKARLVVPLASPPAAVEGPKSGAVVTAKVSRPCFFGSNQPVATGVFRPGDIPAGGTVSGPSIIEEPTTTIVVYPGMSATLTPAGNYLLNVA